jgi:hypothetical protein
MKKTIIWAQGEPTFTRPLTLRATCRDGYPGLSEGDIDPMHEWCMETGCGKRTSFDTFKFRSETEMSMFLLRWSNDTTNNKT